tara:strand:+ start:182 stop:733 length:552 start_codon:yes stop_codon:yes gene_type:complete
MPVNAPNHNLNLVAPDFNLLNIDNTMLSLDKLKGKNGTVIAFICNHCPYVKDIAARFKRDADELLLSEINTIAIMSNDVDNYPEDSFENMKKFSNKFNFNFPYLYDETQNIAKKYGAVCTPDFYGFDKNLILKYRGRIDSGKFSSKNKNIIQRELFNAMIEIKNKGIGPKEQINSLGCSIKWK